MSALAITPPFPTFSGKDGLPLEDGYIWIGSANQNPQTSPVVAYWDETLTQTAQQPIRTLGGYPAYSGTPARLFIGAAVYSILVQDKNANTVYNSPSNTGASTFVNFAVSEEVQVATAGQTVFTLANTYTPGTNSLTVYVDGVNQYDGAQYSFVETSGNTVTFTSGLHVGALVKFSTAIQLSGGVADSSQITYVPAGTGAVTTNVQSKLRESVSVKDFGAVDTPANATAALTAALAAHDCVFVNAGTYDPINISANNKTLVMDCNVVFKLPDNTSPSGSEIVTSVLTISGDNVSIFGIFVVDGNGNNNAWSSAAIQGSLNITGNDCSIFDKVTVQFAYGPGVSVWNGTSVTSADMVEGLYINEIEIVSSRRYSAYFWGMNNFKINKAYRSGAGLGGANSTDTRIRTGTQQSSSAYCQNGSFGVIQGLVTYETRTRNCHIGRHETVGGGSKAENAQNCVWDQIIVESPVVGTVLGWSFADGFVADLSDDIRCKNNSVGLLYVKNATYDTGSANRVVGINDCQNIRIDSLIVEDSDATVATDFYMRTNENIFIDQCVLTADGASRGYFEEGGYVRTNVVINNLVSTGHTTDVEQASGNTIINRINDDAVSVGAVVQRQVVNILSGPTITVGSGADFPSIFTALQFVTEKYHPVFRSVTATFAKLIIELQSGYVWSDAVVVDGVDLGWVTIKPASGVTTTLSNVTNLTVDNGGVSPKIEGAYTKAGSGNSFIRVLRNSSCIFAGSLAGHINVPILAYKNADIDVSSCTFTKDAGATVAATSLQSLGGSRMAAISTTTDSQFQVAEAGLIFATSSTGTLSQTANTITASGIIFK